MRHGIARHTGVGRVEPERWRAVASATMRTPARRHLAALGTGAVLLCGALGCSSSGSGSASTAPTSSRPATSAPGTTGTTGTTAPAAPTVIVPFWIRDQVVAAGEARPLLPGVDPLRAAIDVLLARPNDAEKAEGYETQLQSNVSLYDLTVEGDTVVVNFTRTLETHNTQPQVAQIVFTLTQFTTTTGVSKVRFLIDGQPNGAAGVPAVGRDNFDSLTPPALLDTPTPGTIVTGGQISLTGTTRAAITSIAWVLSGVDGPPLAQGTITATPPDPDEEPDDPLAIARGTFATTIAAPGPSTYAGPAWLILDPGDPAHVPVRIPLTLT